MNKYIPYIIGAIVLIAALIFVNMTPQESNMPATSKTTAVFDTSMGTFSVALYDDKAPITVANFIQYANSGFYAGTVFHRVIPGFMVQGGGFTPNGTEKRTGAPIKNEAANGLQNLRGTIAMARTSVVDSATSQFFINVVDNGFLDYKSPSNYGYAVFGKVISGMDVVDKIAAVKTGNKGDDADWPVKDVIINSVTIQNA